MMDITIRDKSDYEAVEQIISIGYPQNNEYMQELLAWSEDPNWPIAGTIYEYFRELGDREADTVFYVASHTDQDSCYTYITQIIACYGDETLKRHVFQLRLWAKQPDYGECCIESLRLLAERKLIPDNEIADIAKRNLFVYNLYIKHTFEAVGHAIFDGPLINHKL